MFFILSKVLLVVFSLGAWLAALLVAALVARPDGRWRARWLWAAAVLMLMGGNGALVNSAMRAWEQPAVALATVAPADAAVLLTGITVGNRSPHDRVYLNKGADRLTNALWLYKAGRVRRIIISGGSGATVPRATTEATELATLLRLAGVPQRHILVEERSRNTHENAQFTKELLTRHPEVKTLVLVTSAFHQRRAMACFAKVGLHPVAFPADFRSFDPEASLGFWLIPSTEALNEWGMLLHEMTGYVIYRLQGYL